MSAPASSPFGFRPARASDIERLVDIHTKAYPDARGRELRARQLTHNRFGGLEDLWVATGGYAADDTVVALAFLYPLEVWFGGAKVRASGIASVGVAPEARRCGVGSALVGHLHEVARGRGDVVSVLYPYRQRFYERLGYAPVTPYRRLRFAPAAVPWSAVGRVRPVSAADGDALRACWRALALRRTGTIERTDRMWETRLLDERRTWLVVEGTGGVVEGYISFVLEQPEAHAATTLQVREWAALSPAAERALWGVVAAQQGQVAAVEVDVAADDPLDVALVDGDRGGSGTAHEEHLLGHVLGGPMLRLLDVPGALAARGWCEEGSLVLQVGDRGLRLEMRGGRASVSATRAEPDVRTSEAGLAAVACGALRAEHAARLGWLEGRDAATLALAERIFVLSSYFSPDPF